MQIHNTSNNYGIVAKLFHWILAIMLITVWSVGTWMADHDFGNDPFKFTVYGLHKSFGMTILMLAVARLVWKMYTIKPVAPNMHPLLKTSAIAVHHALYLLMICIPLSGYIMSSAYGYNPTFFWLFEFPSIVPKNMDTAKFFAEVHEILAEIGLYVFLLHVAAALVHHFWFKDDTLKRML